MEAIRSPTCATRDVFCADMNNLHLRPITHPLLGYPTPSAYVLLSECLLFGAKLLNTDHVVGCDVINRERPTFTQVEE
jgi:hypothetical protein